jgi:DNA-binding MarR family transcriptional regulator
MLTIMATRTVRSTNTQLAAALRDAITRLNRRLRQTRPMGDLTISQLSALTSLELAGALSPRELAEVERIQPPTLTRIVAKLEARGLVQRSPHPTDGRQVILSASESGRAFVAETKRRRDEWLADGLSTLSAEEREILRRAAEILGRLGRSH